MTNYSSRPCLSLDPFGAALTKIVALVAGEVEYKGQRCRRIAWFMDWKSPGEEAIYKETEHCKRKNGEWRTVLESFTDELQNLGMVGYETCYAKFAGIYK